MFKENFERICFEKRISPSSVCEAVGLNRSTYSLWTNKSVPRKGTLKKLCDYLGCTEGDLLGEETEPQQREPTQPPNHIGIRIPDFTLSEEELEIIIELRKQPDMVVPIRRMLGMELPAKKKQQSSG